MSVELCSVGAILASKHQLAFRKIENADVWPVLAGPIKELSGPFVDPWMVVNEGAVNAIKIDLELALNRSEGAGVTT